MTPLIAIFVLMVGLLSAGWQWPLLLAWSPGDQQVAMQASFLAFLGLLNTLLILYLRRFAYLVGLASWAVFAWFAYEWRDLYLAANWTAQAALLILWLFAATERPTKKQRRAVYTAAAIHGGYFAANVLASFNDPGWTTDKYDLFMRVYGPWAPLIWLPAGLAIIGASWLAGRKP